MSNWKENLTNALFKALPTFYLAGFIVWKTINYDEYWKLPYLGRFILAIPLLLIVLYLMRLLEYVWIIFNRRKYELKEEIKSIRICNFSFLGHNFDFKRFFYYAQYLESKRVLSLVVLNKNQLNLSKIYTFKSLFSNQYKVFDLGIILELFFKLILSYIGYYGLNFIIRLFL